MKEKEHSLLYHTMHSRPMPGCLPLFFLLSMVVVGAGIWLAPVEMPQRTRPKGIGRVYVKNDRLTNFVLRRQSPLPLHLPLHADPEYREDLAAASMPLLRNSDVVPAPPQVLLETVPDSAVLDAAALLALPVDAPDSLPAEPVAAEEDNRVQPEVVEPQQIVPAPVFHPGVEKEIDEEEVQP